MGRHRAHADAPTVRLRERPLRRGPYRGLLTGSSINVVGDVIGTAALPLFVLETTHDLALTGWIATVSVGGSVVTGLLQGPLIDRLGFRASMLFSSVFAAATTLSVYLLHVAGLLTPPLLLLLALVRSVADEPGRVAIFGIVPQLAGQAGVPLERANATLRTVTASSNLVGPLAAGGIAAFAGSEWTILLNAITGLLGTTVLLLFARAPRTAAAEQVGADEDGMSYYRRFRIGLRYLFQDKLLRTLVVATMVFAAFDSSFATIGLTAYAAEVLHQPALYGGLISAFGIGSLVGTIGYGAVGHKLPKRRTYLTVYLAFSALVLLMSLELGVAPAFAVMAAAGLVTSPLDMLYMAALQERVPKRLFGRVISIANTVLSAPAPLAVAAATGLISSVGVRTTMLALGCGYLALAVGLVFVRHLHKLDTTPVDGSEVTRRLPRKVQATQPIPRRFDHLATQPIPRIPTSPPGHRVWMLSADAGLTQPIPRIGAAHLPTVQWQRHEFSRDSGEIQQNRIFES
ncbi:MFS transporter [Saccharopolyspora sp. ID03-671]|uniref:MFS transporter n=1 Tax=Saccharopolyspora sp. ID03-671 TaxID=3073066 RepID=UPI00324CB3DF